MDLSKTSLIIGFILLSINVFATGELVLSGVYHGTNLYIQNPHDGDNNYCIKEIYINNKKVEKVPQATAFDVDLSHITVNDPIEIKIIHGDNCTPKIINPNAIRVRDQFQFLAINVNDGDLIWSAKGEKKLGKYFILKYEHSSWVTEKVIQCEGNSGNNTYSYPARHHTGKNLYKIKYLDITGKSFYSPEVDYFAEREKIVFYPKRVSKMLSFSASVKYEIHNLHGEVVKKGTGEKVDCSDLKSGVYYLSFDNRTEKFVKK